jgi:diketogulonate reductase-like aldo/keto reductase
MGDQIPRTKLNDGHELPMLAYGLGSANFQKDDEDVSNFVTIARANGIHHFDNAEAYGNETGFGAAVKRLGPELSRDSIFVTTKMIGMPGQDAHASLSASLEKLGLDYVDMYMIHVPFLAADDVPRMWSQMEELKVSGKARSIGVSNFTRSHLEALLKHAEVKPAVLQTEYHPYLQHGELLEYCRSQGIALQAYGALGPLRGGRPGPLDETYAALASKYGVSEGEIALRWCLDQGISIVTTSRNDGRLQTCLSKLFTFTLTPDEISQIAEAGKTRHYRAYNNDFIAADDTE